MHSGNFLGISGSSRLTFRKSGFVFFGTEKILSDDPVAAGNNCRFLKRRSYFPLEVELSQIKNISK